MRGGGSEGAALGLDGTVWIDRDCVRAQVRRVSRRSRQIVQSMAESWIVKNYVARRRVSSNWNLVFRVGKEGDGRTEHAVEEGRNFDQNFGELVLAAEVQRVFDSISQCPLGDYPLCESGKTLEWEVED